VIILSRFGVVEDESKKEMANGAGEACLWPRKLVTQYFFNFRIFFFLLLFCLFYIYLHVFMPPLSNPPLPVFYFI
jgi:hypothetical protein